MKSRVMFSILSMLIIFSMLLTACGTPAPAPTEAPKQEAAKPTEAPKVEAPTEAPKAAAGGAVKELKIIWAEWDPSNYLQQLVNDYEKEAGVKVTVVQEPWGSFADRVFTEFAGKGGSYDLVIGDSQWLGQGATQGHFVELTDIFDTELNGKALSQPTVQYYAEYPAGSKKYWAYPTEGDAIGWSYRKDLFEDPKEMEGFKAKYGYDLAVPQDLNQLRDIAEWFNRPDKNQYGIAVYTQKDYDGLAMGIEEVLWNFGGDWGNYATGQVKGIVNSEDSIKAVDFYKGLYQFAPPGSSNDFYAESLNHFTSGEVAMAMNYFAFFPGLVNEKTNKFAKTTGFFSNPKGPKGDFTSLGGQGMSIVSYISPERQAAAKDFLKWFAKTETQQKWADLGGYTCNADILKSEKFLANTPYNKAFSESMLKVKDFWNIPVYVELLNVAKVALHKFVVGGEGTAKEAMDAIAEGQDPILKDGGYQKEGAAPAAEVKPAAEQPQQSEWVEKDGLMSVKALSCDYGNLIKEIVAVDPATVKFSMCAPDPAFPQKAAFSAFGIRSKANIEATGGGGEILEKPIGTGAYKIESWKRGDSITMVRNDEYWGKKGIAQKLVFRWSPEAAQRLLELESGTVDGIDNPGPDDFEKIKNNPDLQLIDREALNVMFIALNNTKPPFDNVKVRQAIAMGIDRERIVKTFYPAGSVAASHFTPCAIENACAGEEWYKFDAAKAKALLKEAGFENGFETKLYYRDVVRGYLPQVAQVAQDIQDQLQKNLNIKATIEVQESGTLIDNAQSGRLEMYLLGWGADYPHITNFLDYHFGKSQKMFGDSYPDIYNLLVEGAKISDTKKAEPIYAKANKAIKDLVPMVPVAHGGSGVAFRKDVKNAHASPLTNEYFGVMDPGGRDTLVWMQNAEPISLYCNDETDGESLRACEQVIESLLAFEPGGTKVEPALAESCDPNADLTEWVCKLRKGVKFHDGAELHANDVVMSWGVAWDAANKFHKGNTGAFEYFSTLWGSLLNVPPAK